MNATINGNSFVKVPHLFVPGEGTFYPDKVTATRQGTSVNGVGFWIKEYAFGGAVWYQAGNANCWD